jgi:serine O-acetyltransferase
MPTVDSGEPDTPFWTLIAEDWRSHHSQWGQPGFRALFMYRFGVWRMRVRPRLLRMPFSRLYWLMHRYVRNHYSIELHATSTIGRRLRIAHSGAVVIHEYATIGDDCIIRQGVTIGAADEWGRDKAPVLGDRVNVGAGAMLLGSITIGDDVRVGPNAVVTRNVPANSTVAPPPVRIIKLG